MANINKIKKILGLKKIPDDPVLFENLYPEAYNFLVRCYAYTLNESYDYELALLLDEGVMQAVKNFAQKHPKITQAVQNGARNTLGRAWLGANFVARNTAGAAGGLVKGAADLAQEVANKSGKVGGTVAKAITAPVKSVGSMVQFAGNMANPKRGKMQEQVEFQRKEREREIDNHYGDDRKKAKLAKQILNNKAWLATYDDPRGYRGMTANTYENVKKKVTEAEEKFKQLYGELPRYAEIDTKQADDTGWGTYDREGYFGGKIRL